MPNPNRCGKVNILEVVDAFKDDYKNIKDVRVQYDSYEAYIKQLRDDIEAVIDRTFGVPTKDKQFMIDVLNGWIDYDTEDFHSTKKQYDIICGMMRPGHKKSPHRVTQEEIERARQYPIDNLLKFNRAGKAYCIFHVDKGQPNLHKYDNTCYCFSCGKKADVIDVYMQQTGESFIDAVKKLAS